MNNRVEFNTTVEIDVDEFVEENQQEVLQALDKEKLRDYVIFNDSSEILLKDIHGYDPEAIKRFVKDSQIDVGQCNEIESEKMEMFKKLATLPMEKIKAMVTLFAIE